MELLADVMLGLMLVFSVGFDVGVFRVGVNVGVFSVGVYGLSRV